MNVFKYDVVVCTPSGFDSGRYAEVGFRFFFVTSLRLRLWKRLCILYICINKQCEYVKDCRKNFIHVRFREEKVKKKNKNRLKFSTTLCTEVCDRVE